MSLGRLSHFGSSLHATRSALSIIASGVQTVGSVISERTLKEHCLVFVESGSGFMRSGEGAAIPVVGPALIFLVADLRHTYGPTSSGSWHERWVLFDGVLVDEFFDNALLSRQRPVLQLGDPAETRRLFADLHSRPRGSSRIGEMNAALDLHALLVKCAMLERQVTAQESACRIEELINWIQDNAGEELCIESIAEEFEVALSTLRRRCIELTGVSPKKLQTAVRLARAKELLVETDAPISKIAETTGFSDPYYFSRVFSGRNNCSPTEFRRLHRRS